MKARLGAADLQGAILDKVVFAEVEASLSRGEFSRTDLNKRLTAKESNRMETIVPSFYLHAAAFSVAVSI